MSYTPMRLRKGIALLTSLCLAVGLTACGSAPKEQMPQEILTQTVVAEDKIPVTVLVKYAFSINAFEKAAEERFPQLDIIQVGNYTSNMGIAEMEARMEHDDLTDIVMTWPLNVGEQYWSERLIDLSAMSFTGDYVTSMLDNISSDGKLYYLPGPSQVRGIVYNKTLFEENGWEVPKDFDGFIALCKEIENSGIRSLQLGLANAEVLDTAFVGYGFGESFSKPGNTKWIEGYNNGVGNFEENFAPALNNFQTLINENILRAEDLNVSYADRENMIFTRQCAMVEDSVLLCRMGESYNGCTDEFAMMPFFGPGEENDWARLYPVCYIGVSKKLEAEENREKYDLVMELLKYISTPEGQEALAADTGAMFSSLKGVAPPDIPEIRELLPALTHGRYAIFPTLKNAQSALRTGLAGMVKNELTASEVAAMVDKQNLSPPIKPSEAVVGTASMDFTLIETGNFITDVMREQSGCEIALFLDNGKDGLYNGKGVSGRIYSGDVTHDDIGRILPDLKQGEKGEMQKITMTGENLINTLEHSITVNNDVGGWFYYFSGLKMEYAPAAKPGTRIKNITDQNGNAIDPKKLYTIAIMDQSVPETYIESLEETGVTIKALLEKEVASKKEITPSNDGRFVIAMS